MRDFFFLAVLPLMLYPMFRKPFIAVGMWIWTAMFYPNAWFFGVAGSIRYNLLFAGVAVLSYLAMRDKPKVEFGKIGGLALLFFAWTTLSTMMTIGYPEVAWDIWNRFFKVMALFLFVCLVIDKKLHIDFFLWCAVLSIGFFASLEGLKFVVSGGGHKIAGFPGHVLGDRNELAVAFVMTLPIAYYLLTQYGAKHRVIQFGLLGLMGLLVTAVIGTNSRGGFIALLGLAAYMFVKSDRKIVLAILGAGLVFGLSSLVSDDWLSRMDTIGEANEDASFMSRVVAWKLSFILAMDHPVFGGGFKALETVAIWSQLSQRFLEYPFFFTGDAVPNPYLAKAAHSIYFQVLGEHGFVGLALYLGFIASSFFQARRIGKRARANPELKWAVTLTSMLQLCIFAFCLGGAALNFAYFELTFSLCGIILVLGSRIIPAQRPAWATQMRTPNSAARTGKLKAEPIAQRAGG